MAVADRGTGKDASLFVDGIKVSGELNSLTLDVTVDTAKTDVFEDEWKGGHICHSDWTLSFDGFYSAATAASNAMDKIHPLTIAPGSIDFFPQGSAVGKRKWSGSAVLTGYSMGAPVAGAITLSGGFTGAGTLTMGTG